MKLGARRLAAVRESATLLVQKAAQALRDRGVDVIDLGVGEPDFETPKPIADAIDAALYAGHTKYTPTIGLPELRSAIAGRYQDLYGGAFTAASVAVTVGAKQALYNLFLALLEPGDEVLVPTPCWVSFPSQVLLVGASPRLIPCRPESRFVIEADAIAAALTPRSRMLILNSPCNPTGAVIPRATLAAIVDLVRERDMFLVFDETYEHFVFEGEGHVSAASFHRELGERLIVVNSFSKTYAMTGLRAGFVVADPEVVKGVASIQSHTTSNPTSIVQYGAMAAIRSSRDSIAWMVEEYRRRRQMTIDGLAGIPGVDLAPPGGAFYAFPRVVGAMQRLGITGGSVELASRLLDEAHVAVVPGLAFEFEGFLRLSFAANPDALREGLRRLKSFLTS